MAAEQRFFDVRAVEGGLFVLAAVVPRCKVGSLIGTERKVINEIRDKYDCDIEVLKVPRWFDPTVILRGKDEACLIEAFNRVCRIATSPLVPDDGRDVTAHYIPALPHNLDWVCRIATSPLVPDDGRDVTALYIPALPHHLDWVCRIATSPLVPDDGRDVTALYIPARPHYLKSVDFYFTSIAEKFDTSIEIIGVSRVPSLPYDNIIKIIGDRKNVRKTASNLAEDLCKCQRNSELLFKTPNNIREDPLQLLTPAISPLIVSRNIRVSDEYAIPVETAVDYINTWTEIVSAVTKDTSKVLIIEVIGKHTQVDQAIQFLQKVIGEASLNDENVF